MLRVNCNPEMLKTDLTLGMMRAYSTPEKLRAELTTGKLRADSAPGMLKADTITRMLRTDSTPASSLGWKRYSPLSAASSFCFFISGMGLLVLRPLLAYCTIPR
jgi:hypothetical protein